MPSDRLVRRPRHDVAERPFLVIWEATRACPLACRHCRAEAQTARHPAELDTAGGRAVLEQAAAFGRPGPLFVITGGDPFQRPDLDELIAYGAECGLRMAVSPSGTPTLTRDRLARIRDAGAVALSLSVDGSHAALHDGFRGVPGVFDWTLDAWRAARDLGLKVQINTTLTRHNHTDLADVARLVRDEGAMLWSVFLLVPTGRGRQLAALGADEVEDALNFVHDMGAVLAAKTTEAPHFRRIALQRAVLASLGADPAAALGLGDLYRRLTARAAELELTGRRVRRPPMDVGAGRGFVFVSHTGDVHPSGFLPMAAGNVRDQPLTTLYRESPLLTALRDPARLGGKCGRCEFNSVCGGSRSRAYGLTGDPFAADPWCAYRPGSFPHQEQVAALLSAAAPARPRPGAAL